MLNLNVFVVKSKLNPEVGTRGECSGMGISNVYESDSKEKMGGLLFSLSCISLVSSVSLPGMCPPSHMLIGALRAYWPI